MKEFDEEFDDDDEDDDFDNDEDDDEEQGSKYLNCLFLSQTEKNSNIMLFFIIYREIYQD